MDDPVWAVLFFFLVALPAFVVWLATLLDIIASPFMGMWRKIAWVIGLILFPVFGILLYLLVKLSSRRELTFLVGPEMPRGGDRGYDEQGYVAR